MPDTVGRWNLRRPLDADIPSQRTNIGNLATDLADVAKDDQGLLSARPVATPGSPNTYGRYYLATDTGDLFRCYGTGWAFVSNSEMTWVKMLGANSVPTSGVDVCPFHGIGTSTSASRGGGKTTGTPLWETFSSAFGAGSNGGFRFLKAGWYHVETTVNFNGGNGVTKAAAALYESGLSNIWASVEDVLVASGGSTAEYGSRKLVTTFPATSDGAELYWAVKNQGGGGSAAFNVTCHYHIRRLGPVST